MTLLILPVSADNGGSQTCGHTQVAFTQAPATAGPYPVTVQFSAQAANCPNCHWQWTISRVDQAVPEVTYSTEGTTSHTFNRPGRYLVEVTVYTRDGCSGYKGTSRDQREIEITGTPRGYGGACLYVSDGSITPREERGEIGISPQFTVSSPACIDCTYSWRVREVDYPEDGSGRYAAIRDITLDAGDVSQYWNNQRFAHNFREPGTYEITSIIRNPSSCPADLPGQWISGSEREAVAYYRVSAPEYNPGVNGVCDPPTSVRINQIFEHSTIGSSITPYWTAEPAFSCRDCVYSWSIFKTSAEVFAEPVPLGSNDLYSLNGKTALSHSFTEPGDYKIYLRVVNPPACPTTGSNQPYAFDMVIHHVAYPSLEPAGGEGPGSISPPGPAGAEVPPGGISPQEVQTGPGPVVTAIPMELDPLASAVKASAGGIFQKSSPASALTSANRTGNSSVPARTKAAPGLALPCAAMALILACILLRRN